jgi:tetratricopeptide (TPR) repeat protein
LNARSPNEDLPEAKKAVAKALEIDDTVAEAHSALGQIKLTDWDWAGAERAYKRAIELDPNSGYVHTHYSQYLRAVRRFDEAIASSKRAVELEPVSAVFNRDAAINLYYARRYDEVIEQCQKTLELDPNMSTAYGWLAGAYEQKKLYDQSIEAHLRDYFSRRLSPEAVESLREAYATSGWRGSWRKSLDLLKEQAKGGYVYPYLFAQIYARLGERDQAFAWLEKAYEERSMRMLLFHADPVLDDLRSDPRYSELLRKINLAP